MRHALLATGAIALNTFREISRDKIVYAFFAFAIGLLIFGQVLGSLSIGQQARIIQDTGLAAIDLIGSAIAIFAGANLLYKERERGTIQFIFSKPVNAVQFVTGKFAGIAACLGLLVLLMSIWLYLILVFSNGPSAAGDLLLVTNLACAAALSYAEIVFVVALSIFFACFASPLMSVVFTIALWIAAHANASLLAAAKLATLAAPTAKLLAAAYWLLPDLETATRMRSSLVAGIACDPTMLTGALAYLACYIAILLMVSSMVTNSREQA